MECRVTLLRRHLNEWVGGVEMVGAEEAGLLLDEDRAEVAEERILGIEEEGVGEVRPGQVVER